MGLSQSMGTLQMSGFFFWAVRFPDPCEMLNQLVGEMEIQPLNPPKTSENLRNRMATAKLLLPQPNPDWSSFKYRPNM